MSWTGRFAKMPGCGFPIRLSWILAAVFCLALPALGVSDRWHLEGLLTDADPRLAPGLVSGWVLVGSLLVEPSAFREEAVSGADAGAGRLLGGITEAELAIELYYQLEFAATQAEAEGGLDYFQDNPQSGGDALGWFIPMQGQLKDSEWQLAWLQIWLFADSGRLIRRLPLQIPPRGLDWERGWARLTFVNADGELAYAAADLSFFGPDQRPPEVRRERDWQQVANDLAIRLRQQDALVDGLRLELARQQDRMDSLRDMVSALINDRTQLEQENRRLLERIDLADSAALARIDALKVDNALLEENLARTEQLAGSLQEQLAASERQQRLLREELAALEANAGRQPGAEDNGFAATPAQLPGQTAVAVQHTPSGTTATMVIVERPPVIEPLPLPLWQGVPETSPAAPTAPLPARPTQRPRKYR